MKTSKSILSFLLVFVMSSFVFNAQAIKDIRLLIVNGSVTDELLVGFWANATDGFDAYDSHKIPVDVNGFPEIYTMAGTEQVVINGLPLMNVGDTKQLTLGYRISCNATLTIKVKELLNLDSGTVIILKDKVLNKEMDLMKVSDYTFTSTPGENNDRFTLTFFRNAYTAPVATTTTTTAPAADTTTTTTTTTAPATTTTTEPTATTTTEPTATTTTQPSTTPDFNVRVSTSRTLEVQLVNLASKGTKIMVNTITGRRILSTNATGNLTYISTPLAKGQYVVTVTNKAFNKSKTIVVN